MKKILCILLLCILLFALTSCSNLDNGPPSDTIFSSGITEETQHTLFEPQASPEKENTSETEALALSPISKKQTVPSPSTKQPQSNRSTGTNSTTKPKPPAASKEKRVSKINVQVGNSNFTATLVNNSAVDSFVKIMKEKPIVIQMSDYSGFEKVGSLGSDLPTSNSQTTTQSGDIVLYNGNQVVIFYGSNSWSYTRLGTIDDLSGWKEALGNEDVEVTFRLQNENYEVNKKMKIRIKGNGNTIFFELNNSLAAKDLYAQLPLTVEVENFSTNEKIFYPPKKLTTTDTPLADAEKGTLCYYAPWALNTLVAKGKSTD